MRRCILVGFGMRSFVVGSECLSTYVDPGALAVFISLDMYSWLSRSPDARFLVLKTVGFGSFFSSSKEL